MSISKTILKKVKTNNSKEKQGSPVFSSSGLTLAVNLIDIYISVSKEKPCTRSKYLNHIFVPVVIKYRTNMFYHTVFMLTIAVWMKQIIIVHHIILIPQLKYQPPNQDYIYNNSSTEGVNIYLTEQLSNPVSSTVQTYYWTKKQ